MYRLFQPEQNGETFKTEIDSVMAECDVQLNKFYATNKVIIDAGVESETKTLRLINSKLNVVKEQAVNTEFNVGGAFIIEAVDLEEAVQVVSLHPAVKIAAGENLGWRIEIREVHHFFNNYINKN